MPTAVEYQEQDLADVEIPATNDGARAALTDLRYGGQGEEYIQFDVTNGSDYAVFLDLADGRTFKLRSGQSRLITIAVDDKERGVTWAAIRPSGGNIPAGQVVVTPTIRRPLRGST